MANSDFNWVPVNHTFTVASPTVTVTFPIEGTKAPQDDGYLLLQIRSVHLNTHKIFINNKELPSFDLPPAPGASAAYQLWMDHIPPGFLQLGNNTLRIDRAGNDDFFVRGVSVNWRE